MLIWSDVLMAMKESSSFCDKCAAERDLHVHIRRAEREPEPAVRKSTVIGRDNAVPVLVHSQPFPLKVGGRPEGRPERGDVLDDLLSVVNGNGKHRGDVVVLEHRAPAAVDRAFLNSDWSVPRMLANLASAGRGGIRVQVGADDRQVDHDTENSSMCSVAIPN